MWPAELHGIGKAVTDCLVVSADADPGGSQGQSCGQLCVAGRYVASSIFDTNWSPATAATQVTMTAHIYP